MLVSIRSENGQNDFNTNMVSLQVTEFVTAVFRQMKVFDQCGHALVLYSAVVVRVS